MIDANQIQVGTRFVGNVNGETMEVVGLQRSLRNQSGVASIKILKTGTVVQYGLEALRRCNITVIE